MKLSQLFRRKAESLAAGTVDDEVYRTLFDMCPVAVYSCDASGVIQEFNRHASKLWGREPTLRDTDGRFCGSFKLFHPDGSSMPHEQCPMADVLSGKSSEIRNAEVLIERPDGSRISAIVNISPQKNQHGEITAAINCFYEITARKQTEAALLEAGALQSAIFNSANFSSIATDAKGVIQIFNVGAERMLGYTAAEVMNKITPADISDPQEVIARATALSAELATTITPGFEALVFKALRGIEDIYELTYIRKDGSRFPAIVSVTALRDDQDAIIGYLLIGTDNTARKQVEAEQKKLDQRLRDQQFYTRSLIESNIDALMMTDPQGIISDVNQQMIALTGCTRDELIGAPFKNYFTDPEQAEAAIKLMLIEKKVINYELTARARDGKETVMSYNATTFYDRSEERRVGKECR